MRKRILTSREVEEIVSTRLELDIANLSRHFREHGSVWNLPADACAKAALARFVTEHALRGPTLLCVCETGVFPSCEAPLLFNTLRRSRHPRASLRRNPGEILSVPSRYATALLAASLYNFWDVLVLGLERDVSFYFSHDEWMSALVRSAGVHARIVEGVARIVKDE